MEFSEDEADREALGGAGGGGGGQEGPADANQNYLIERIISGTKAFLTTSLFHRVDMNHLEIPHKPSDADDATTAAEGFSMNLRSKCSGDCVMQGLPHAHHDHHHRQKPTLPACRDQRSTSTSPTKSKDLNDNPTLSESRGQQQQQQHEQELSTLNESAFSSSVSTSSRLSSCSFESDCSEVSQRYIDYLNSSQEERDRNKTDYTYAHSASYSRFVDEGERFNWPVPNMSRQSIHSNNNNNNKSSKRVERHTVTSQRQTSTMTNSRMAKIDFNPNISSTPTRSSARQRRTQQLDAFSDEEDVLASRTSMMKINTSGSSPEAASNMYTEEEGGTSYRDRSSAWPPANDDQENVHFVRNVKNSYVTRIYNYFSGKETPDQQQEVAEGRGGGHSSSYYHTTQSNTRNKYLLNNGNAHYGGGQQPNNNNKIFWLWVLAVGVPLVFLLNYYFPLGAGASYLINLLPAFKLGSIWPETISSGGGGGGGHFARPYTSEIDAFKLREELSELRDIINAQQIQLQKQHRQQEAAAAADNVQQPEVDELKEKLRELELRMISCCQKKANSSAEIEEEVRQLLQGKWLEQIRQNYDHQLQTEVAKVQQHLVNYFQEYAKQQTGASIGRDGSTMDTGNIEQLIRKALAKYDADKTGEADYALESTGAYIVSTRCSESYQIYSGNYQIFGVTVWRSSNSPREVIQPRVVPGECWCFRGATGRVAIHLSTRIVPTAFAYEHIPLALSREGNIDSAPQTFAIYGLKSATDLEPVLLGRYTYSLGGEPLQRFEVSQREVAEQGWDIVEMVVEGNHGHPDYTCLYRLRVHGVPVSTVVP